MGRWGKGKDQGGGTHSCSALAAAKDRAIGMSHGGTLMCRVAGEAATGRWPVTETESGSR